jgi:hypothetical protein
VTKRFTRSAASTQRRKSHTWHGVKVLAPRQGLYKTPDGRWSIEFIEDGSGDWHLDGPGHDRTRVSGPAAACQIIRAAQEADVTA